MSKHKVFRFKKFDIDDSRSSMKVGTDGVLIGAWTRVDNATRILDIGTGSGVIAIMMAQRSGVTSHVDAVEISEDDVTQARINVQNSPWPEKISIHFIAVQNFLPEYKYDLIVTNPPYFNRSQHPPDPKRLQARHTESLSYRDVVSSVLRLLEPQGTFSIVLPPAEGGLFVDLATRNHLHLVRKCLFKSRPEKDPERWMLEFRKFEQAVSNEELVLYSSGERWSEGYRQLTKDFYLNA